MFRIKVSCSTCEREIKGNEEVNIRLRWPKRRGFTEIKAYLKNWGTLTCNECIARK